MDNIVIADIGKSSFCKTRTLFRFNYGQILKLVGVDLPPAYEVHFSNEINGESKTQIGNADGVLIPREYFQPGKEIYAWLYLHATETSGETVAQIIIPISNRATITDEEPLPEEQTAIAEAIVELNKAVKQTGEDVEATATALSEAVAAKEAAEDAQNKAEAARDSAQLSAEASDNSAEDALNYKNAAELAQRKAEEAQAKSEAAKDKAEEVQGAAETARDAAKASAQTSINAAQLSLNSATESATSAQTAASNAAAAQQSKEAAEAAKQTAANKANEAAQSAEKADQAKLAALTAKDDALSSAQQAEAAMASAKQSADDAQDSEEAAGLSANKAITAQTNAERSATEAKNYADNIKDSAEAAATAADNAVAAKTAAETAQRNAEAAKDTAVAAVAHNPKIENGTWYVWNQQTNAYVDTGVEAQGPQGDAYNLTEDDKAEIATLVDNMKIHICSASEYDSATGIPTIAKPDRNYFYLVPGGEGDNLYIEWVYLNDKWEQFGSATIDLSNYVQKTDYATISNAGVVKVSELMGISMSSSGLLKFTPTTSGDIRNGVATARAITPSVQHNSVFYGLAKAAGDTTQSQSSNAVGTYTDEAKAAIQQMLGVPSTSDIPDTSIYATKADTVLETTLSMGRKAGTTVGQYSTAIGIIVEASGQASHAEGNTTIASNSGAHAEGVLTNATGTCAHAEGQKAIASGNVSHAEGVETIASGQASHAEGRKTTASGTGAHAEGNTSIASGNYAHAEGRSIASGANSHAEGRTEATGANSHTGGKYNVIDSYSSWAEWIANTSYVVGDKVKVTATADNVTTVTGYICKTDNSDAEFTETNWTKDSAMNFAEIVGNGTADDARSNAYALDWDGNGHYAGDVYVHANADSTGGTKLATIDDIPEAPVQDVQINGISVVENGVANVPVGNNDTFGVYKTGGYGVTVSTMPDSEGTLAISSALSSEIKAGSGAFKPITASNQHKSAFYGLAKAAGADEKDSTLPVGQYTDTAKTAIRNMIGATSENVVAVQDETPTDPDTKIWIPETADAPVQVPTVEDMNEALAEKANVSDIPEVPVQDVQVNGTSVVQNGVANVPLATASSVGVAKVNPDSGIIMRFGDTLAINSASESAIKSNSSFSAITPNNKHTAAFYGLAKAAGDTTQSQSSNAVGQYTDAAKAAIQSMLGVSQMLAPVNPNMTAAQAYGVGEVFAANGKLYKATAAIAQDAAIIPETNCVETTIAEAGGKIKDVQVAGSSVVGSDGVANVPMITSTTPGIAKVDQYSAYGINVRADGTLQVVTASDAQIKSGTAGNDRRPITPSNQHLSTFYGLSKIAGVDLKDETVTLGTYPEASKTAIKAMLGVEEGLKVVRLI